MLKGKLVTRTRIYRDLAQMGKDIVQSQGKTNVMVASLMQGTMAMVLDLVDNNTAGGVVFSVQRITILIESHLKIANKMEVYKMKKVYEVRMENWEYRNRKNNLTTKQLADHACYCGGNCLGDTYNVIGRFNTLEEARKLFESSKDKCTTTWGLEHGLHTYTYDVLYIQSIPLNEDDEEDYDADAEWEIWDIYVAELA